MKNHLFYTLGIILLFSATDPAAATPLALATHGHNNSSPTTWTPVPQPPTEIDQPAGMAPNTDSRAMIQLAKQQLATMGHQGSLHDEHLVASFWADEVTGVYNLEMKLKLAMMLLRDSKITMERCLKLWTSNETD